MASSNVADVTIRAIPNLTRAMWAEPVARSRALGAQSSSAQIQAARKLGYPVIGWKRCIGASVKRVESGCADVRLHRGAGTPNSARRGESARSSSPGLFVHLIAHARVHSEAARRLSCCSSTWRSASPLRRKVAHSGNPRHPSVCSACPMTRMTQCRARQQTLDSPGAHWQPMYLIYGIIIPEVEHAMETSSGLGSSPGSMRWSGSYLDGDRACRLAQS